MPETGPEGEGEGEDGESKAKAAPESVAEPVRKEVSMGWMSVWCASTPHHASRCHMQAAPVPVEKKPAAEVKPTATAVAASPEVAAEDTDAYAALLRDGFVCRCVECGAVWCDFTQCMMTCLCSKKMGQDKKYQDARFIFGEADGVCWAKTRATRAKYKKLLYSKVLDVRCGIARMYTRSELKRGEGPLQDRSLSMETAEPKETLDLQVGVYV
jgi:hypothetical protein